MNTVDNKGLNNYIEENVQLRWNDVRVRTKLILFPRELVNENGEMETKMFCFAKVKQRFGMIFYGVGESGNINEKTYIAEWEDLAWV